MADPEKPNKLQDDHKSRNDQNQSGMNNHSKNNTNPKQTDNSPSFKKSHFFSQSLASSELLNQSTEHKKFESFDYQKQGTSQSPVPKQMQGIIEIPQVSSRQKMQNLDNPAAADQGIYANEQHLLVEELSSPENRLTNLNSLDTMNNEAGGIGGPIYDYTTRSSAKQRRKSHQPGVGGASSANKAQRGKLKVGNTFGGYNNRRSSQQQHQHKRPINGNVHFSNTNQQLQYLLTKEQQLNTDLNELQNIAAQKSQPTSPRTNSNTITLETKFRALKQQPQRDGSRSGNRSPFHTNQPMQQLNQNLSNANNTANVSKLSSLQEIQTQNNATIVNDSGQRSQSVTPLSFRVHDTQGKLHIPKEFLYSKHSVMVTSPLNDKPLTITRENPLYSYLTNNGSSQQPLGVGVITQLKKEQIDKIHGGKVSMTNHTKFSKIPINLRQKGTMSPTGQAPTIGSNMAVVLKTAANSRAGLHSLKRNYGSGERHSQGSAKSITQIRQQSQLISSQQDQIYQQDLRGGGRNQQKIIYDKTDDTQNNNNKMTNGSNHRNGFTFQPVRQNDGVSFVSPVINHQKQMSALVPHVTNKRILQNNKQHRNKIKRGSTVSKTSHANKPSINGKNHPLHGYQNLPYFSREESHQQLKIDQMSLSQVGQRKRRSIGNHNFQQPHGNSQSALQHHMVIDPKTLDRDSELASQLSVKVPRESYLRGHRKNYLTNPVQELTSNTDFNNLKQIAQEQYQINLKRNEAQRLYLANMPIVDGDLPQTPKMVKQIDMIFKGVVGHKITSDKTLTFSGSPNDWKHNSVETEQIETRQFKFQNAGSGQQLPINNYSNTMQQMVAPPGQRKLVSVGIINRFESGATLQQVENIDNSQDFLNQQKQSVQVSDFTNLKPNNIENIDIINNKQGEQHQTRNQFFQTDEQNKTSLNDPQTTRREDEILSAGVSSPGYRPKARISDKEEDDETSILSGKKEQPSNISKSSSQKDGDKLYKTIQAFDKLSQKQSSTLKLKGQGTHLSSAKQLSSKKEMNQSLSALSNKHKNAQVSQYSNTKIDPFQLSAIEGTQSKQNYGELSYNEDLEIYQKKSKNPIKRGSVKKSKDRANSLKPQLAYLTKEEQKFVFTEDSKKISGFQQQSSGKNSQIIKGVQQAAINKQKELSEIKLFSGENHNESSQEIKLSPKIEQQKVVQSVETFTYQIQDSADSQVNSMNLSDGQIQMPDTAREGEFSGQASAQQMIEVPNHLQTSIISTSQAKQQQSDTIQILKENSNPYSTPQTPVEYLFQSGQYQGSSHVITKQNLQAREQYQQQLLENIQQRANAYRRDQSSKVTIVKSQIGSQENLNYASRYSNNPGKSTPQLSQAIHSRVSTRLHANENNTNSNVSSTSHGRQPLPASSWLTQTNLGLKSDLISVSGQVGHNTRPNTQENSSGMRVKIIKRANEARTITLRRNDVKVDHNRTQSRKDMLKKQSEQLQSDVYVYGPPVIHWVQTMREKMKKAKTAGFDHDAVFLGRRLSNMTHNNNLYSNNQIQVPENVAAKVLEEGKLDYRPSMGQTRNVIHRRKTQSTMSSYLKSGHSLTKEYKDWNARVSSRQQQHTLKISQLTSKF